MDSKERMGEKGSKGHSTSNDERCTNDEFCVCTCPNDTCCGDDSCCGCGGSLMCEEVSGAVNTPDQDGIVPSDSEGQEPLPGAYAFAGGGDEHQCKECLAMPMSDNSMSTERVDIDSSENHLPGAHALAGSEEPAELGAMDVEAAREEICDQLLGSATNAADDYSHYQTPMLEAELVQSHVQAVQVQIDEVVAVTGEEIELQRFSDEAFPKGSEHFITRRRCLLIVGILLVVVVVLAVTVGVLVGNSKKSRDDEDSISTPTAVPSFDYVCHTSTLFILQLQRRDDFDASEPIILCPNTRIQVGRFANPVLGGGSFVDGDYPLTVLHDDVTIQCGRDGRRENNCIVEGGALQVVIQAYVPSPDQGFIINGTANNVTLKGLTFTGQLLTFSPLVSTSVTVGIRGRNIVLEDCLWINITAPESLIMIGQTAFETSNGFSLERQSAELTLRKCAFENVVYGAHLIYVERQSLRIEQTSFRNIGLPEFMRPCDQFNPGGFCAGLLYCFDRASCSMSDVCVDGFDVDGRSMMYVSNDTDWTVSGSNVAQDLHSPDALCELAITEGTDVDGSYACSSELVFEQGDGGCPTDVELTQSPTFPYDCFSTTLELLEAQRDPQFSVKKPLVICPNTTIVIGRFASPINEDFRFVDGDYPIMALHSNVTVQCGIDGRRENNCVVDGGAMQAVTLKFLPSPEQGMELKATTIDNFTVRGMTFTGNLESAPPFTAMSVVIGFPGTGILFEDCLWANMTTSYGLIAVGQSTFEEYSNLEHGRRVSQVKLKDCEFNNIKYDNPLIISHAQDLSLEQCTFRNVAIGSVLQDCDHFNPGGKCAGLVYCFDGAACSIQDICLNDFEMEGRSLIYLTDDVEWNIAGNNFLGGAEVPCELAVSEGVEWNGPYDCTAQVFEKGSDMC